MAIVNKKSTAVTNGDASPQALTSQSIDGGRLRERVGFVEIVTGDSIGSVLRMVRVSSGDRVSRVLLSCDANNHLVSIGLYDIAAVNNGAAVNATFFASSFSLVDAQVNVDVTHDADAANAGAGFGLKDVEKPLWQALGLTSDPGKQYDIGIGFTSGPGLDGTVVLRAIYVDGN